MNSVNPANSEHTQTEWNQYINNPIATENETRSYTSYKYLSIVVIALGAIAYLTNENQTLSIQNSALQNALDNPTKPNHWSLENTSNPLTNIFFRNEVCNQILATRIDSITNPVINLNYKNNDINLIYKYSFSDAYLSPLELLIHNNCQEAVKAHKEEILDPNFDFKKLQNLIVAAAAAQNKPLWDELMNALNENSQVQHELIKNIKETLNKSKKALDFTPSSPSTSDNYYGTPYDVAISLQETEERALFLMKIFKSPYMKTVNNKILSEINDRLSKSNINTALLDHLEQKYTNLIQINSASILMPSYKPKLDLTNYPHIQKYIKQNWTLS